MSKQKLNGIVAGQISYLKDSLDDSDLLTSSMLVFFGYCYHLQFPSENRAPRGLPFSSELFLSVCAWPHCISSLQQADTNSLSPLISKATPLLGAAHRGIFSSWLVVAFGCERSHLCLIWLPTLFFTLIPNIF